MIRALLHVLSRGRQEAVSTDEEWRGLLALADRTHLTLYLRGIPGLPNWLTDEIEARYARNARRRERLREALAGASAALSEDCIPFVLLKGFTHEALGVSGAERVQYDLDILVQPTDWPRAAASLARLGYRSYGEQSLSAEHSRPLVRPSEWRWRGDYYDPDMPIPVELHDSVWSPERDRIRAAGVEAFWSRRRQIEIHGLAIPGLAEPDRVAFAALHALRHVLRHNARPAHVLELARFLNLRADDAPFWSQWRELHPPELRALETVAFRFAHEWFGCCWPEAVAAEWSRQPEAVISWFREFAWSPVANLLGSNKDTVWLHLALVPRWSDRARVLCNRLMPMRVPHEPFLDRVRYHAGAFAPALWSGLRWWRRRETSATASQISDWNRRSV